MIRSFACKDTRIQFETGRSKRWSGIASVAERKLVQLHVATELRDLASPPANRLEALSGDHQGQHSIRVNEQWRICFYWTQNGPTEVEIVDYH